MQHSEQVFVGIGVAINIGCGILSEKFSFYVHDTKCVREAGALPPASHDYYGIASFYKAATLAEVQSELHTHVHVLHPIGQWWFCMTEIAMFNINFLRHKEN